MEERGVGEVSTVLLTFLLYVVTTFPTFTTSSCRTPARSRARARRGRGASRPHFVIATCSANNGVAPDKGDALGIAVGGRDGSGGVRGVGLSTSRSDNRVVVGNANARCIRSIGTNNACA